MLRRLTYSTLLLTLSTLLIAATSTTERIAFEAAVRAFEDQFYDRAETQFKEFTERFADSDRFADAEAFLLRARAHNLAEKNDHGAAARTFRDLRLRFPNSPNHLEYVIGEAWSEYHQGNWDTVTQLLGETKDPEAPKSPFQLAATIRPNDPIALPLLVSGQLLLAQTYLDQKAFNKAEQILNGVTDWDLRTEFSWRRRMITTQLQLASGDLETALKNADGLMYLATATGNREWIAESASIYGELLVANDQPEAAIVKYQQNLAPGTPPKRHREAWLKIIELNLEQRDAKDVIVQLRKYISEAKDDDALDVGLLTLGELNIQRYYEEKNKPEKPEPADGTSATDFLNESRVQFERLLTEFPNSPLAPSAQYHLGWCYWELGASQESVTAFQQAAEQLPKSFLAAVARFKLADGFYVLGEHQKALDNYKKLIEVYENVQRVKETFLDQVLYQTVRASVEADDMDSARMAISKLIGNYPDNLIANTSRLLVGQHMIHIDKVSDARGVFYEMIEHFTDFPLKAEVEFAIAYSFELEGNWAASASLYKTWIDDFPEHKNLPRAAYALAWCTSQAGKSNEALTLFRRFVKNHGNTILAQKARLWIGNHYFNRGNFELAERQFGVLRRDQSSNKETLRHQAILMASRASFRQNKIPQTINYLEALSDEIKEKETVSPNFKAEVELSLGDALFEQGRQDTGAQDELIGQARLRFATVSALHEGSRLAAIGYGRYADASYFLKKYPEAIESYERVINDFAEADISIRSQAEVGLGMVYERQAEQDSARADNLQKKALEHYLNIVYWKNLRTNELPDPFWLEEAGIKAGLLVEARQDHDTGIKLYQRLAELLPSLRADWDQLRLALLEKKNQGFQP